ncbi:MAG: aconitate hydratase, partial [Clostridia bacterium]|nr:aconitate hydratase [Clostridia bacterium]
ERAMAKGGGVIVGGHNYGQGSSREHAALVPLYLGVKAVIAKSFARIHRANLINFGILPLEFKNEADYDTLALGDGIKIAGLFDAVANGTDITLTTESGAKIPLSLELSDRQRMILAAGGLLNYTKGV